MSMQRIQILGLLGVLGSLLWLSLNTFLSPDWGPPGTSNYLGYETINRLWAPAFALMLCGFVGLYQRFPLRGTRLVRLGFLLIVFGLIAMIAGNVAEFWFFAELPYGAMNARSLAWSGVLLGMLTLFIGVASLGLTGLRYRALPLWGGVVFLVALPLVLAMFLAQFFQGAGLVVAAVGLTAGALVAWPSPGPMKAKGAV